MAYLLDTCTWIQHLKDRGGRIEQRIFTRRPEEIFLCSIVKGELWHGARIYGDPDRRREALREVFLPHFSLPFDDFAAWEYGRIKHDLASKGSIIGPNDLKIAAIARHHDLTVVTSNTREFRRVPGLVVEDWTQ